MTIEPSGHASTESRHGSATVLLDALEAALCVEHACADAVWGGSPVRLLAHAFGAKVKVLGDDAEAGCAALEACESVVSTGGRASAFLSASALADARRHLLRLVDGRRPVVLHVVVHPRGRAPTSRERADLQLIAEAGAGVLVVRHAQDAADLAVVAHRIAQDAKAPIVLVHEGFPASHARDLVSLPDGALLRAVLAPLEEVPTTGDGSDLAAHRLAGERIPFALASAMRVFERLSGRKLDVVEAAHLTDAELSLVAAGAVSETARALVEHLRAASPSVRIGVLQVVSLRPFPGAQIVKALGRARAVAVVERTEAPLSQSSPLALEVKAAFADALTWAPGYPGIGRIPNVYAGCIDPSLGEATPGDLLVAVENVLQGELGRRVFRLGASGPHEAPVPTMEERSVHPASAFTLRLGHDPDLSLAVLGPLHQGHVRATPRLLASGREAWDVTVSPWPVRVHHGATELDVVVLSGDDRDDLEAVEELAEGGVVVVMAPSTDQAARRLSASVRDALHTRGARVMLAPEPLRPAEREPIAIGAVLRARPGQLDRDRLRSAAERVLRDVGVVLSGHAHSDWRAVFEALSRALDACVELPPGALPSP